MIMVVLLPLAMLPFVMLVAMRSLELEVNLSYPIAIFLDLGC